MFVFHGPLRLPFSHLPTSSTVNFTRMANYQIGGRVIQLQTDHAMKAMRGDRTPRYRENLRVSTVSTPPINQIIDLAIVRSLNSPEMAPKMSHTHRQSLIR